MMKQHPRFRGPSLLLLAIVHVLLFAANLAVVATLRHGAPYINPFAPAEAVSAFFMQNPSATRIGSFFLFGSAVPVGLFAVTTVSWLRFLKVQAAGVNITLFGGLTAAFALILSGLSGWIVSLPDIAASAPLAKAIYFFSFLSGGVTYAVGFGLLAAGVSVTSYFTRHLPRWLVAVRNDRCSSWRVLFAQPDHISSELPHPHHAIPGIHLDAACRRKPHQESKARASSTDGPRCVVKIGAEASTGTYRL